MHDEDPLVRACQSGDVAAFEALVRKYQNRTVRMLYLLLGDLDDAQDVAQETFIRAFRNMGSFRGRASFGTWLHRIALNAARNWVRDNRPRLESLGASDDRWWAEIGRPDDELLARERAREVRRALARLPEHYREAIVLRHFEELSYQEIAEVQQVPVGTVRSRLAKGRELLQEYFLDGSGGTQERRAHDGLQKSEEADPMRGRRGTR